MLPLSYYVSLSLGQSFFTFDNNDGVQVSYRVRELIDSITNADHSPFSALVCNYANHDQCSNFQGNIHTRYIFKKYFFWEGAIFIGSHQLNIDHFQPGEVIRSPQALGVKMSANIIWGGQIKLGYSPHISHGFYLMARLSDIVLNVEKYRLKGAEDPQRQHYMTPFIGGGIEITVASRCRIFAECQYKIPVYSSIDIKNEIPEEQLGIINKNIKISKSKDAVEYIEQKLGHKPKTHLKHWRFLIGTQIQIGSIKDVG